MPGVLAEVGATGFEPATSCSRSRRSTGLSYAPMLQRGSNQPSSAPMRTRTSNLLIRSQMLYPIELWALAGPHETDGRLGQDEEPSRPRLERQPRSRRP